MIEVNDKVRVIAGDVRRVDKYKANINKVFNEIANKQMEDFHKLITQLPEDCNEWTSYFHKLEREKGSDPVEAVKKVPDINGLVKNFEQSSNKKYHNNHRLVEERTEKLLEYIGYLPQDVELVSCEELLHMMSCM